MAEPARWHTRHQHSSVEANRAAGLQTDVLALIAVDLISLAPDGTIDNRLILRLFSIQVAAFMQDASTTVPILARDQVQGLVG